MKIPSLVIIAVAIISVLPAISLAATIHGTVYDWRTLEPISGAVVTINTEPQQTAVARPTYSFTVPQGVYEIAAAYSKATLEAKEMIKVSTEGDFTIDLLLTPAELDIPAEPDIDPTIDFDGANMLLILIALAVAYLLFTYYKRATVITAPSKIPASLSDDLKQALKIISNAGGRMTQRELRMKIPYSEAKVSLVLDDLENRGLIKKFKKGRGNIIRLV